MRVSYGANNHFPGKTEESPGYNAIRNVRGQDTRSVRPNYRTLKGDKSIRERVEVPASPAPGVGQAHIGAFAKAIVSGDVNLVILCDCRVLESQQSASS